MTGRHLDHLHEQALVERVGRPFVIEAVRMLEAGVGTVEDIDAALVAAGYPQGPFRRLDEVGLETDLAVDRALAEAVPAGGTRFSPPALEERLLAEGRTGRAVGRGFYRYEQGGVASADVATERSAAVLTAAAIVERIELAMVNEAYRVVGEGLAPAAAIDGAIRASGHPRGPFEIVDELGLRTIVVRLRELHRLTAGRSGDQYEVAEALWQMATA